MSNRDAWKAWERHVAAALGGHARRRGPATSIQMQDGTMRGLSDIADVDPRTVTIPSIVAECKAIKTPKWSIIQHALRQAALAADDPSHLPMAFIHKVHAPRLDSIACMSFGDFRRFFGLPPQRHLISEFDYLMRLTGDLEEETDDER